MVSLTERPVNGEANLSCGERVSDSFCSRADRRARDRYRAGAIFGKCAPDAIIAHNEKITIGKHSFCAISQIGAAIPIHGDSRTDDELIPSGRAKARARARARVRVSELIFNGGNTAFSKRISPLSIPKDSSAQYTSMCSLPGLKSSPRNR